MFVETRDAWSWTVMVAARGDRPRRGDVGIAAAIVDREGVSAGGVAMAWAAVLADREGVSWHGPQQLLHRNWPSPFYAFRCGYAKAASVIAARLMFSNMMERDVVSWNALIAGYTQNGENEGAVIHLACTSDEHTLASAPRKHVTVEWPLCCIGEKEFNGGKSKRPL
ncbi:pentatricopeptide repeat-containing protein [Sesbania bispinosa]|nr:pentatricopeptide repeat-containing protein [Sesbania bispinosa]